MTGDAAEDTAQPIGALLDALGVRVRLKPGQQLVDAVVLAKAVDFTDTDDGYENTSLVIAQSKSLDWISAHGLLSAARDIFRNDAGERDD